MKLSLYLSALNLSKRLGVDYPIIRFSVEAIRALIVEALIEAFEDASMPKISICFCAHALLLLFLFLTLLQFGFKFLEQLSWNNK